MWQTPKTRKNCSLICPERSQKNSSRLRKVSISLQVVKSTMLEAVHQCNCVTMRKQTHVSFCITRAGPLAGAVVVGKYLREVLILMVLSLFSKWKKFAPKRRKRRWRVKRRKPVAYTLFFYFNNTVILI